jgi:glycolate oxidase FAD binding subunit
MDMPKIEKFIPRLKEIVGEAHLIQDSDQLKAYAIDGKKPKAVVSPGTIEEVSKILAFANEHVLSILPMGNGTKKEMGGIPEKVDVVLSMLRLNRMTDCDCDNLTLSAECGLTLDGVQKRLSMEGKGYFLPIDPPFTEKATLGGIVATNSSGPKRLLYGTARDMIIGAKAVFPNGDIVTSGGKTVKNVSGYDLCKLLIGSYGTLGILCEMTFKLLPLPEQTATLLLPYETLEGAVQISKELLRSQYLPSSMEILNGLASEKLNLPMNSRGNYLVAIGLDGVTEAIERQISEMGERATGNGALKVEVLRSGPHLSFWQSVRDFSDRMMKAGERFVLLKSNFLISRCGDVMDRYEKIAKESGVDCGLICHSGNGILFSYVFVGQRAGSRRELIFSMIREFSLVAVKNEGNLIVESSPPALKKKLDIWGDSRGDYAVMRRLKQEIDPKRILNPGRFVGGI